MYHEIRRNTFKLATPAGHRLMPALQIILLTGQTPYEFSSSVCLKIFVVLNHISERALTPHGPPAMVTPRADLVARGKIKISCSGGNVRLNDAINIRYLLCRAEFGSRGRKRQKCHFCVNFARLPRIPPTSWSLSVSSRGILIDRVGGEGPRREEGRRANSPTRILAG